MALDVRMGDVIEMRKAHPCGDRAWTVVRVGADIGLRCRGCERRILMDRPTLHRRARQLLERGEAVDPAIEQALFGQPAVDQSGPGVGVTSKLTSGAGGSSPGPTDGSGGIR